MNYNKDKSSFYFIRGRMDGRTKRTQRNLSRIKETALQLFSTHGVDKVSMDEIAAEANVSKVTIYKYFHSKEELHREVVNLYADQVIAATEEILNSNLDFMEKLKFALLAKTSKMAMASNRYFLDLLKKDEQAEGRMNQQIKNIIFRFFEEGKQQGYIDESLPFDILYLHSEIYQAGFAAKLNDAESILEDQEARKKMLDLFFFGIIKG
jgi:AcrR family transcriptional regulator